MVAAKSLKASFHMGRLKEVCFGWHEPPEHEVRKATFLAIPGIGHTSPTFERLGDEMARRGFEVRVLNLPEHLEQVDPSEERKLAIEYEGDPLNRFNLERYSDCIVEFARGFSGPVYILGHSMGGLLAQMVAAKMERSKLGGVVLLCSAVTSESRMGIGWGAFTQTVKNVFNIIFGWAGSFSKRAVYRLFLGRQVSRQESDRFSDFVVKESGLALRQILCSTLPAWAPFSFQLNADPGTFAGLPILHIRAEKDRIITAGTTSRLLKYLLRLGAKIENTLIDGPHNLIWTHPDQLARIIEGWHRRNFTS